MKPLFLVILIVFFSLPSYANDNDGLEDIEEKLDEQEIMKNALSSFSLPLDELLKKKKDSDSLFSEFSGGFSFSYPLKESTPIEGEGVLNQGRVSNNLSLSSSLSFRPLPNWFFSTTFYKYINQSLQAPWNPDFSYTFGYDDWHPYTFSLTYANYGGNRLFPKNNEVFTDFLSGGFNLGWKFTVPRFIEELFIVHKSGGIGGSISYSLVPKYLDLASLESKSFKQSARLTMKYTIYEEFYANATFFYYPFPEQQQPWDPDFTYGFGFFDWHPGSISIQYNNYSGNRYPWNKKDGTGGFQNGGFSISWSWTPN
jgi:hypothetical protein